MNDKLFREFCQIVSIPKENRGTWLASAEQSVEFLKRSTSGDRTIVYASGPCGLVHTVLAPLSELNPPDQEDLSHNFPQLSDGWIMQHASGGGEPDRVYLEPPLAGVARSLKQGQQLIFQRSFAGRKEESPLELDQKLVHSLNLHLVEERSAFCRLDDSGDIEEVIKIHRVPSDEFMQSITFVSILTKEFMEYMRLAEMGAVTFFDFTRFDPNAFNGWQGGEEISHTARDLFYHGRNIGSASYVHGRMVFRPAVTLQEIIDERVEKRFPTKREYATFKAINLETRERMEVSCGPDNLRNYFQPDRAVEGVPLELSPAFFKPEVLAKYKSDREKYDLEGRSVGCRGTWHLKTFDINEAGQVHTYLVYLRDLPYSEQVYWQSFNEWPKAWLSKRAIETDFMGQFSTIHDSLISLKSKIMALDEEKPEWWNVRGKPLRDAVHYPATESSAEWGNELLALDQLVVEGFLESKLRALATGAGVSVEAGWRSLKLLEAIVESRGRTAEEAKAIIAPFRQLHELRTTMKGHSAGSSKLDAEKSAKKNFGNYRAHFTNLAERCNDTLGAISELLGVKLPSRK